MKLYVRIQYYWFHDPSIIDKITRRNRFHSIESNFNRRALTFHNPLRNTLNDIPESTLLIIISNSTNLYS